MTGQGYFDFQGIGVLADGRSGEIPRKVLYPVHSRTSDPTTSYEAGGQTHRSGARGRQSVEVLDLVCQNPGMTSAELAAISQRLDRYQTARVLPSLADKCLVSRGPARLCSITKRRCICWFPTSVGRRQNREARDRSAG